jgi:hypothetical protein
MFYNFCPWNAEIEKALADMVVIGIIAARAFAMNVALAHHLFYLENKTV